MPYITTDILCGAFIWLAKTDIQIVPVKPSAYAAQTFIAGRVKIPAYEKVNSQADSSIRMPDGTDKEIILTDFPASLDRSEIKFVLREPLPLDVFLPFEKD